MFNTFFEQWRNFMLHVFETVKGYNIHISNYKIIVIASEVRLSDVECSLHCRGEKYTW